MVLFIVFAPHGKGIAIDGTLDFVDTRSRILILDGPNKGPRDFHFLSAAAESEPLLLIGVKVRLKVVDVGGGGFGATRDNYKSYSLVKSYLCPKPSVVVRLGEFSVVL